MEENIQETILAERKALEYDAPNEELVKKIDDRIGEAKKKKDKIDEKASKNEKYWKGEQLDTKRIPAPRAKIVDNRIFMSIETIIPLLTSNIPEPEIQNCPDNDIYQRISDILKIEYEIRYSMPSRLREFCRNWAIGYIGVLKYRWDKEYGFQTEVVPWRKIGFDPISTTLRDCDFAYEYMEDTLEGLIARFPDAEKEIKQKYNKENLGSKVRYVEFWGDNGKWVCWKLEKIILGKMKNPNFDYTPEKTTQIDNFGNETEIETTNNIFKRPKFPYIIGKYFSFNDSIYDVSSVTEQAIPIQDAINKRKNQISDHCDMNKRVLVVPSTAMPREDFQKILDQVGEVGIYVEGGSAEEVQQLMGRMDSTYYNDLTHSIGELDNIMGTHSTTRGERTGKETATGRQMLYQADLGRIGGAIEDIVESVVEEWYNAYLHMHKVYSDQIKYQDGKTNLLLKREEIPNDVLVMVKKGTSTPLDKATRIELAMQWGNSDKLDPESMYSEVGYPKANEMAEKMKAWWREQGKMPPENQEEFMFMQNAFQMQQMQAQMEQAPQQEEQMAQEQQMQSEMQAQQLDQQMTQKEEEHGQKMIHKEEEHSNKMEQQKEQMALKAAQEAQKVQLQRELAEAKKHAIRKQGSNAMDVRQQARNGKGVGKQNAKPKGTSKAKKKEKKQKK
jgi:hypothetical protein